MRKTDEKKHSKLLLFDQGFLSQGFTSLTGVDEAGRGPWAGPVVASAVIVRDFSFENIIDDSKKMTSRSRDRAYEEILTKCSVGIGMVDSDTIDEINILEATLCAMQEALKSLGQTPDCVLVDGNRTPKTSYRVTPVIDGDAKSFSIACASIVAKVSRDRMMAYFDEVYPEYGFSRHKGYGTPEHAAALKKHGPCRIHRKSFEPIKKVMNISAGSSGLGARSKISPTSDLQPPS